jgi:hypothetical protein
MPIDKNVMRIGRGVVPVIDNVKLPRMDEKPSRPTSIGGKVLLMAEQPKPDTGKTKRMAAVRKAVAVRVPKVRPEMKEPAAKRPTASGPDGYVRVRLRVTGDQVTVMGAKAVEGPLVETKLQGALAYEVTLGSKRLAAGAIPDVGEQRSFPDPKGKGEMAGHHVTVLPTYDVNVRVPKAQLTAAALPRVEIALYRMKEPLQLERLGPGPIRDQFSRELREVGRVKGIRPEKLAAPVATQLRTAFG